MDKDLALAGLAHDLNNVLQTVAQVADLLSTEGQWSSEADLLLRCVDRGRTILESLQEPVSTVQLRSVANRAAGGVERVKVHVDVAEEIAFAGKPLAMERALLNLLWNSARAGATEVRISCAGTAAECLVEVADNGPGIPETDLAKVFAPGFSTTASTGLGLRIVESIVQSHGGAIRAVNRGGACFQISLPVKPPA